MVNIFHFEDIKGNLDQIVLFISTSLEHLGSCYLLLIAKSDAILARSIPYSGVPGARLLALMREGTLIYSGLAGTLSVDDNRPIVDDTVSPNDNYGS